LAEYRRAGSEGVRRRASDCGLLVCDERSHTLMLMRDAVGMTPIYYGTKREDFAFGTRITDVAQFLSPFKLTPNRAALAALLVDHDAAPPDRSYFADVSAVPPGHALSYRRGEVSWLPQIERAGPTPPASFEEAVAAFAECFRTAVRVRLDSARPNALLLSGGLDSAAIACMALEFGEVIGISYGLQDGSAADESRYLDVLRATGVPIERVPFYPTIDMSAVEASVRAGETPSFDAVPLTLQRAADAARARSARNLLLGTWGDQVLAPFPPPQHAALPPWRSSALRDLAHAYQAYMSDVPVTDIRRALMRQSLRRHAPSWLLALRRERRRRKSVFDTLAHEFPSGAAARQRRSYADALYENVYAPAQTEAIEGTTKWGCAHGVKVPLPYLDWPLLQLLAMIPADYAYHEHALKPLLRSALRGVVPRELLERRDKGDYTAAIGRGALANRVVLERLEDLSRLVQHGLMSRAAARKTLARLHASSEIALGTDELAMILLGLDTWLRLFCEIPL
ncbi:MAG TPA: asparagine synthase-related protein, partial [Longimicrobiales bacterium]|nr:asparagine synthase-related protein [Longimicrobiales bacterium]